MIEIRIGNSKSGKDVPNQDRMFEIRIDVLLVQKNVAYNLNFTYTEQNTGWK